jgi:hypothetical protein
MFLKAPKLVAAVCALALAPAASHAAAPLSKALPRTDVIDVYRRLDANRLDLFISNIGAIGYDLSAGNSGLYFPRFEGKSILFASGLWACGKIGNETRVAVSEYSSEWRPGGAPGGLPEDPNAFDQIVYKTSAIDPLAAPGSGLGNPPADDIAHMAWSQYVAGAAPHGAPTRTIRVDDTSTPAPGDSIDVLGPDLPGDLATWATYNDLNPSAHTNDAGNTPPLGLEVRQTIYGYVMPGTMLDDVAFVRFDVRNAGAATIDSAYFAFWADPDLGGPSDDLTGWQRSQGMAYAYNATNSDVVYGGAVPALGFMLLDSPVPASPDSPFGAAAFGRYVNGNDPNSSIATAYAMHGYQTNGEPWIDPATLQPSAFPFDGDPFSGTGWLDTGPADRRMLLSVGPVNLAPGQQTHLVFAIVVGQGNNRLASLERLYCNGVILRAVWPYGLERPFPPILSDCVPLDEGSCPWAAETWSGECAAPNKLTAEQLDVIANGFLVDSRSFDPGALVPRDAFCTDLGQADSARQRAERQYEALLANSAALRRGIVPSTGPPIGLPLGEAVSCPGLAATTVAQLLERCPDEDLYATYFRVDTENPRDLQPVDWSGSAYGGAIDFGTVFFGSSLDPHAQPDSFKTVEIRFGAAQTQKAYRYLRLQDASGSAPPQGRAYVYGGYVDVPFRCVEVATGRTLEVLFVEKAVTDASGVLLPPFQQPATFDSTWSPDASDDGAREYLLVTNRSAADGPRPEFVTDGFPANGLAPVTYTLWLRRFEDGDVIEDGEFLQIVPEPPASPGVDRALFVLARADQADPATIDAYEGIANCLRTINLGQLSPAACTDGTPALATLVDANATPDAVTLAWYVAGAEGSAYTLERRIEAAEWIALATIAPDGDGFVRYVDRGITPGVHVAYRLVGHGAEGDVAQGEVALDVPGGAGVRALAVTARFGAGGQPVLALALPVDGEVRYDLYSLSGRRLAGGSLGRLAAGKRTCPLPSASGLSPGVYLVRVRQGATEARTKALVLR